LTSLETSINVEFQKYQFIRFEVSDLKSTVWEL